eukprot:SAG22_NODE_4017_length_1420_cov_1.697199_1_plen_264_part_00
MQRSGDVGLSPRELLELCSEKKARGNELYRKKNYEAASKSYHEALADLADYVSAPSLEAGEDDPSGPTFGTAEAGACDATSRELHLTCVVNDALCELQQSRFDAAAAKATHALQFDPSRVKALYVRARAAAQLGKFAAAHADLQSALEEEPDNKSVLKELEDLVGLESRSAHMESQATKSGCEDARAANSSQTRADPTAGVAQPSASLAAWISNGGIETFEGISVRQTQPCHPRRARAVLPRRAVPRRAVPEHTIKGYLKQRW